MFDYSIRDRLDYYGLIIYQLLIIYLKQEIELLIPAQTGNRTINIYTQVLKEFCQLITELQRGRTCNY